MNKIEYLKKIEGFGAEHQMSFLKLSKVSAKLFLMGYGNKRLWVLDGADEGSLDVLNVYEDKGFNNKCKVVSNTRVEDYHFEDFRRALALGRVELHYFCGVLSKTRKYIIKKIS